MAEPKNPDTPLERELIIEDKQADDPKDGTLRRKNFIDAYGDDKPGKEPTSGPPRDDTPPPPDSHEPYREPKENPTDQVPPKSDD